MLTMNYWKYITKIYCYKQRKRILKILRGMQKDMWTTESNNEC